MPLPRKKDEGTAAPVLNIPQAHVKLFDVEEHTEPYTVMRKSDGAQFELDPGFNGTVEIVDDGENGDHNGERFFESFKYKKNSDGKWFLKENSKLGELAKVVKPGYFDDPKIPDLTEDDLEGFEMLCRVKPKKNPQTTHVVGSTVDWETMRPLRKQPVAQATGQVAETEEDFSDIPF